MANTDEIAKKDGSKKKLSWIQRNPRTTSLLLVASIPLSIIFAVVTPSFIPYFAGIQMEALIGAAYFSSSMLAGLAIKEWVHKESKEEQQSMPGLFGKMVDWMRDNPKYTKAIVVPIVAGAIVAGVLSGGLAFGLATATIFSLACYATATGITITSDYILPQGRIGKPTTASAEDGRKTNSLFNSIKETLQEHRVSTGILVCLFVGGTVLSGGLLLGLAPVFAIVPSVAVAVAATGAYSNQVLKKEEERLSASAAAPTKTNETETKQEIIESPDLGKTKTPLAQEKDSQESKIRNTRLSNNTNNSIQL